MSVKSGLCSQEVATSSHATCPLYLLLPSVTSRSSLQTLGLEQHSQVNGFPFVVRFHLTVGLQKIYIARSLVSLHTCYYIGMNTR